MQPVFHLDDNLSWIISTNMERLFFILELYSRFFSEVKVENNYRQEVRNGEISLKEIIPVEGEKEPWIFFGLMLVAILINRI